MLRLDIAKASEGRLFRRLKMNSKGVIANKEVVGMNSAANFGKEIATFLNLKESANLYYIVFAEQLFASWLKQVVLHN